MDMERSVVAEKKSLAYVARWLNLYGLERQKNKLNNVFE